MELPTVTGIESVREQNPGPMVPGVSMRPSAFQGLFVSRPTFPRISDLDCQALPPLDKQFKRKTMERAYLTSCAIHVVTTIPD